MLKMHQVHWLNILIYKFFLEICAFNVLNMQKVISLVLILSLFLFWVCLTSILLQSTPFHYSIPLIQPSVRLIVYWIRKFIFFKNQTQYY
jgi:hypothetical protein